MKVKVRCTFVIEVDVPDENADIASFMIEENGCPGTGVVWSALSDHMEAHDEAGTCWACALEGKNEIVA
jgi:hypothetical protein